MSGAMPAVQQSPRTSGDVCSNSGAISPQPLIPPSLGCDASLGFQSFGGLYSAVPAPGAFEPQAMEHQLMKDGAADLVSTLPPLEPFDLVDFTDASDVCSDWYGCDQHVSCSDDSLLSSHSSAHLASDCGGFLTTSCSWEDLTDNVGMDLGLLNSDTEPLPAPAPSFRVPWQSSGPGIVAETSSVPAAGSIMSPASDDSARLFDLQISGTASLLGRQPPTLLAGHHEWRRLDMSQHLASQHQQLLAGAEASMSGSCSAEAHIAPLQLHPLDDLKQSSPGHDAAQHPSKGPCIPSKRTRGRSSKAAVLTCKRVRVLTKTLDTNDDATKSCSIGESAPFSLGTPDKSDAESVYPGTPKSDGESDSEQKRRRSKQLNPWYRFWTLAETQALVAGVAQCGGGKWAVIKKLRFGAIDQRSAVDLKDKWRNLMRIAMLPPDQVKLDKKREATCPPELLAKVRELMILQDEKKQAKASSRAASRPRRPQK